MKSPLLFLASVEAMIDRRDFILFTGALVLSLKLRNSLFAAEPQSRLVKITTYVPRLIFFPGRPSGGPVLLTALELSDKQEGMVASFSTGQTIRFDSKLSSLDIMQKRNGRRVTRLSLLPKSLAAVE